MHRQTPAHGRPVQNLRANFHLLHYPNGKEVKKNISFPFAINQAKMTAIMGTLQGDEVTESIASLDSLQLQKERESADLVVIFDLTPLANGMLSAASLLPASSAMGRTAYDLNKYVSAGPRNLRRYLQTFELPLPLDCESSDTLLRLPRPDNQLYKSHENRTLIGGREAWRRLEYIRPTRVEREFITSFIRSFLPSFFLKDQVGVREEPIYSLPSRLPDTFYSRSQCDIEMMKPWLLLPLVTATRIMHISHADSVPYVFREAEQHDGDRSKFQYLTWSKRFNSQIDTKDANRLVFAFQTPFVLNEQDFIDFIGCTSLPPKHIAADTMPARYRLWAKIWEACYKSDCRWFVLTSYTHWVFGVFSESMRTAFVTSIYRANNASPTILELMVYWIASASGNSDGYVPEETMEPIDIDDDSVDFAGLSEQPRNVAPISMPPPRSVMSDYAFPRQYDTSNDPNIDLSSVLEGEGSLLSYYPVQEKFSDPLKQWLATSRHAQHRKLDEDDFAPVNLYDVAMSDEDIFDPSGGRGEWMI